MREFDVNNSMRIDNEFKWDQNDRSMQNAEIYRITISLVV